MPKLIQTLFFLFFPSISIAKDLPKFFESIEQELFSPDGMSEWKLHKNIEGKNFFLLQWENPSKHELTLKYRDARPNNELALPSN